MAFVISTASSGGSSKTAGTTLSGTTTSADINAGDLILVLVAKDNNSTGADSATNEVTAVSDGTNTYTKLAEWCNSQASAGAGATVAVYYSVSVGLVAVGTSITVTHSSVTARVFDLRVFTKASSSTLAIETAVTNSGDGVDPPSMTISGLTNGKEYLLVRVSALEAASAVASTNTTNWIKGNTLTGGTTGGSGVTNMSMYWEYRIANNATSYTSDPTVASSDNASLLIAISENFPKSLVRYDTMSVYRPFLVR